MKKEKIILSDCDGCMLDWHVNFEDFLRSKGFSLSHISHEEYMLSRRYKITPRQVHDLVKEFNETSRVSELPAFADAVKWIQKLKEHGFKFIVVTSISDNPVSKIYRDFNLYNVFGDVFKEVICLPVGSSKQTALEKWENTGFIWIEDHFKNAEAGHEVGLKTILVDAPYNRNFHTNLFPRVSSTTPWEEIYHIVIEDYKL